MGDSETVVAQTSAVYASSGYDEPTSSVVTEATGDFASSAAPTDGTYTEPMSSILDDGNKNESDPVSAMQEDKAYTAHETAPASGVNDSTAYDTSVNGNVTTEAGNITSVENGNPLDNVGSAAIEQFADGSVPSMSAEEERLWSIVRVNSLDFNSWTELIDETEKVAEDNILKIRKVYDSFLAEFPLCYGYWKKYADHEARFGSIEKVVEIYERAVQGVTYSVDIWLHYCIFAISTYGDPDTVRRLFERGLAYVGTDYLSYTLWDKYIEYEFSQQQWGRLAMIYTRILENPNQQLERYLNSFKDLAASQPLSELRTAEEAAAAAAAAGPCPDAGAEVNEGEANSDAMEQSVTSASAGITDPEELQKYITSREEIFRKAKEFDSKIIGFETAIRRPYFHVRPLNVSELENWHHYLDFIEREEDLNKVVKLYERCLIACANYPEYWIRYVLCMEACGSMDLADNALGRASQVFVKRQPEIHLFAARFKEKNGDIVGARASFQLLHTEISPGLLEAIVKHANMERRLGKLDDALQIYEQAIAIEKEKEHSQVLSMLYAQYSRFIYLVSGNVEKAREILAGATEHVQLSKPFLEGLIHLESIQSLPKRIDYLDALVEKFIVPNPDNTNSASPVEREELSCIYLEFLDTFGDSETVKKADDRHSKLFLRNRSTSEFRKRQAEDFLASDRSKMARSYSGAPSPAQSLMGAYPSAQTQWPAGYAAQPQAWPQAAQPQVQQWTPGYTQQAAYSAYGGYGASYTTPQAPTAVPQNAAYGAYPPTYPAQPYPQQSYVQPTTPAVAATMAPAPQAASVPQAAAAYYGTYY